MSKESLDDILRSLETHPSGYVQHEIQNLWKLFQKESAQFSLGNLTLKDHVCQKYKKFVQAAVDLGRAIAKRKLHLVYGGSDRGLSKLVSEAAFVRGSQVLGIIPKALKPLGCLPDPPTGEELVISCMQERIYEILNHSDAFSFLPGDLAILEALITFASWVHLNIHYKPIAKKLFICAPTANELLDLLQDYKPEPDPMTLALDWATDDDDSNSRKKCKLDLTLRL
ncbi:hypothetical protein WN944_018924 [Citrus x changshan-huyou]|uniref:cytokinin riboside 5'-monophosphate phosphoribohydrolase n=1 Tax=Citrus x changshan-huyou TaxID=2935761 RepID=A0AAP0LX75_9ROSI